MQPWILHLLDHGDVHVRKLSKNSEEEKNQLGLHCPSWVHIHTGCFGGKSTKGLNPVCIKSENMADLAKFSWSNEALGHGPQEGL